MEEKSKVLIVGATGYIGQYLARASLAAGHRTYVLCRPDKLRPEQMAKVQKLLQLKAGGAFLLEGSFDDFESLVSAVRQVDVVISALNGPDMASLQITLVQAIKEAGNIKRFYPSEFGTDPSLMGHALAPGNVAFVEKMKVRKAIEEARIPFTYISANCYGGYFIGNLCQLGKLFPSKDSVLLYGDGNVKAIFLDENDIGTYTIKTIDDPRTLNKTVYFRPKENILSQRELVQEWEKLIGKELEKTSISEQDFLNSISAEKDYFVQIGRGISITFSMKAALQTLRLEMEQKKRLCFILTLITRV
ncbi:hypothetical protein LUZ60_011644 [Juncus effusus]|nr:hypothetical protein LUZ60_011644 [Juncus effusus]